MINEYDLVFIGRGNLIGTIMLEKGAALRNITSSKNGVVSIVSTDGSIYQYKK